MNNLKYLFLTFCVVGVFFASCNKEDFPEESIVTYLPLLSINGPSSVVLDCSETTYADPGIEATEDGVDVSVITTVEGKYFGGTSVDGVDDYLISYVAYNKDSIPGAELRSVLLPECNGDLVASIAGMYKANVVRNGNADPTYFGLGYIIIKDLGNGEYQLSDAIGGYYDFGRGYGHYYASTGLVVTANDIPGNNFSTNSPVGVGAFGGSNVVSGFTVDATNKKISFVGDWDFDDNGAVDYTFEVELTQVDL